MEQEDGNTLTLSYRRHDSLVNESHSVWEKTNSFEMEGSTFELFTIPDSKAFEVGILICGTDKGTDKICMKIAVSADGNVFPVEDSNGVYPAIGHSCTLDGQPYNVYRDKKWLKS